MWANLLITLAISINLVRSNNLCHTFEDYATLEVNPNCWYDPDLDLNIPQVIRKYGYPCEIHEVMSDDGYSSVLFRIPHNGTNPSAKRVPVMLQHGHSANGKVFVLRPGFIAFILANEGFDVWIGNMRSTVYTEKHLKYDLYSEEFWNFSFHEMGLYDIPKMVELIVSKTGQKVVFIGHSMGTTMGFIYASMRQQHAQNHLQGIVALAPIAHMENSKGISRIALLIIVRSLEILRRMSIYGYGNQLSRLNYELKRICRTYPLVIICAILGNMAMGSDPNNLMNPTSVLAYIDILPAVSFKTSLHYLQIIRSEKFRPYDYGPRTNMQVYNSIEPPLYNLSNINVPTYLFYGKRDQYSTEKDTFRLYNELTCKKMLISSFEEGGGEIEFDHGDFLGMEKTADFYKLVSNHIRDGFFY